MSTLESVVWAVVGSDCWAGSHAEALWWYAPDRVDGAVDVRSNGWVARTKRIRDFDSISISMRIETISSTLDLATKPWAKLAFSSALPLASPVRPGFHRV